MRICRPRSTETGDDILDLSRLFPRSVVNSSIRISRTRIQACASGNTYRFLHVRHDKVGIQDLHVRLDEIVDSTVAGVLVEVVELRDQEDPGRFDDAAREGGVCR